MPNRFLVILSFLIGLCTAALLNGDFSEGTDGPDPYWIAYNWNRDGAAWNNFILWDGYPEAPSWSAWDINPTRVYQDFNLGAGLYTLNFWAIYYPAFGPSPPNKYFRAEIKTMPVQTVLLLTDVTATLVAGQEPNNSTWKNFSGQFVVPTAGLLRITFYAGGLYVPGYDSCVINLDHISIVP